MSIRYLSTYMPAMRNHTKTKKWELVKAGLPGKKAAIYAGSCVWSGKMYLFLGTTQYNNFLSGVYVYNGKKMDKSRYTPETYDAYSCDAVGLEHLCGCCWCLP